MLEVFCEHNLSPVPVPEWGNQLQPPMHAAMMQGMKPAWMVYDWTLNRAQVSLGQDWSQAVDASTPAQKRAVQICAALAVPSSMPVIFDLENIPAMQDDALLNTFTWFRQINKASELWFCGVPEGKPVKFDYTQYLSRTCIWAYNEAGMEKDAGIWHDTLEYNSARLDRDWPGSRRLALLCPVYTNGYEPGDPTNGKPIPLDDWTSQLKHLQDLQYSAFIWTGAIRDITTLGHLRIAASMTKVLL